jgi:ribosomal protein S18 acetylase RimI-like enzyme
MEKTGKAFARLYWYHDDNDTVYLDWLSVVEECRRRGVGRELQEMREKIGQNMGAKTACLMVENNTWMHDWYARRGYKDWKDVENYSNFIWMKKLITPKLEQ